MWKIAVACTVVYACYIAVEANTWPASSNSESDKSDSDSSEWLSGCIPDDTPDSGERRTLLGAYEDVDTSALESPEIQDVAKFAVAEIAARLDSPNGFNLINVNNAKKQIVSGVNYDLNIMVIPNQCDRKSEGSQEDTENASCPPRPCDNALNCDVIVYVIPWLHQMKLDDFECKPDQSSCPKD